MVRGARQTVVLSLRRATRNGTAHGDLAVDVTIDVHAHYFPDAFLDLTARLIDADLATLTKQRAPGAGLSAAEMIGQLDAAGIDMQVLSPANLLPFLEDVEDATSAARETNDIYADLVGRFPTRYAALGVVPLPHVEAAITEAGRCFDELGAVGIALGCSIAGRQLDDPSFEPFWRELDGRGAVIFLHPVGMTDPSLQGYNLNWVVGAPFEDTLSVLRLVLSGVTTRYPNLRVLVPHMGGTIPFLMARIDRAVGTVVRSSAVQIELPVSKHLRRVYYDTSNRNPYALRCAIDTLGPDAMVLGTDFPYSVDEELRENVEYVSLPSLDDESVTKILQTNAASLFGLRSR